MKTIKELSRVEIGNYVIRELMTECDTHGQIEHREINGQIHCCQCKEEKLLSDNAERNELEKINMRAILLSKMRTKGVSTTMVIFSGWQYDDSKNTDQRAKIIKLQEYSKSIDRFSPNLIIFGRTGTGKTMLANAIAVNHYLKKEQALKNEFNSYNQQNYYDHTCELITSFNIGAQARLRWNKGLESEYDYVQNLVANELLIIDDLGAGDGYDKDRDRIAQIITLRHSMAPTIITTNMDIKTLREFLGDRAWDRLQQKLLIMECNWDSYRAKTAIIQFI